MLVVGKAKRGNLHFVGTSKIALSNGVNDHIGLIATTQVS